MGLTWPKNPKLDDTIANLTVVEARLATVEQQLAALADQVAQNVEVVRVILTLLHPDPDHPVVTGNDQAVWLHDLVMTGIETHGRLERPTGG